MTLKKYQDRTLAVVKAYFERLQFKSAVEAYDEVTQEGDIRLRLGKEYGYKSPKGLEDGKRPILVFLECHAHFLVTRS